MASSRFATPGGSKAVVPKLVAVPKLQFGGTVGDDPDKKCPKDPKDWVSIKTLAVQRSKESVLTITTKLPCFVDSCKGSDSFKCTVVSFRRLLECQASRTDRKPTGRPKGLRM